MSTTETPTPRTPLETPPATAHTSTGFRGFLRDNAVSLVAAAVAVGLTALVVTTLPRSRDLESVWVLLAKLTPFVAAAVAVAWLDRTWAARLHLDRILPALVFLGFFCYFVPKQFFHAETFNELYYTTLMMVPFVILGLCLCLRLGGASTSLTMRSAVALLLLQLSGLEDLAFLLVNPLEGTPLSPIPQVWTWADHITVFLGHPPTKYEAYAFIAVHVVLAVAVLTVKGSTVRRLVGRLRPGSRTA